MPDRLIWFELQICPLKFRFAVIPGQPVLFGYTPEQDDRPRTLLLPAAGNERLVDSLVESLSALVETNQILQTLPHAPERAFQVGTTKQPSVHLRIAYADGTRWAAMYEQEAVPANVQTLVEQSEQLGQRVFASLPSKEISGEEALELVQPEE